MLRIRWNADLHRHFVYAVEQLGGEQNATPKKILKYMNREEVKISQVKSHLQVYRIRMQEEKMEEAMRTQQLYLHELLQETANSTEHQPRQNEVMHGRIIEVGESSNMSQGVSYKSPYQSSTIGLNETGKDEKEDGADNNDENLSLELTLGRNYQN